jgi:hypothetical protein
MSVGCGKAGEVVDAAAYACIECFMVALAGTSAAVQQPVGVGIA